MPTGSATTVASRPTECEDPTTDANDYLTCNAIRGRLTCSLPIAFRRDFPTLSALVDKAGSSSGVFYTHHHNFQLWTKETKIQIRIRFIERRTHYNYWILQPTRVAQKQHRQLLSKNNNPSEITLYKTIF